MYPPISIFKKYNSIHRRRRNRANLARPRSSCGLIATIMYEQVSRHGILIAALMSLFILLSTPHVALGQTAYDFEIIAQTGMIIDGYGPIADLRRGPSINDMGNVAFIAHDLAENPRDGRVFVEREGVIETLLPLFNTQDVSDNVEINLYNQVVIHFSDNRPGPTHGDTEIVRIDNPAGENPVIGRGSFFFTTPFDTVYPWFSLNKNGGVVFSAHLKEGNTVLAFEDDDIGPGPDAQSVPLAGLPSLFPGIADSNRTVVRGGADATAPLVLFIDETLDSATSLGIATSDDFDGIGARPGISDDGNVVAFVGDDKVEGLGIFVATINQENLVVRFKIADLPAGHSYLDFPVVINHSAGPSSSGYEYTVAYMAHSPTGKLGLYTITTDVTDPFHPVASDPRLVVEVGEQVGNLGIGTAQDIWINDALNNFGELLFWVRTTTGLQAIVRTIPTDNPPPHINHIPPGHALPNVDLTLNATVIDTTSRVERVELMWKYDTDPPSDYRTVQMENIGGDEFAATIGEEDVFSSIDYYIWATDDYGISRTFGSEGTPLHINVADQPLSVEWEIPPRAYRGQRYEVILRITNPSDQYYQRVSYSLDQVRASDPSIYWDLRAETTIRLWRGVPEDYQLGSVKEELLIPNEVIKRSFEIYNTWDWIEPWDPGRILRTFAALGISSLPAPFVGSIGDILNIWEALLIQITHLDHLTYTYTGTDTANSSPTTGDTEVHLADGKERALVASVMASIITGKLTTAAMFLGSPWFLAAEAVWIVATEVGYATAADPQPYIDEVAVPEPVEIPAHCIPDNANPSGQAIAELSAQLVSVLRALSVSYIRLDAAKAEGLLQGVVKQLAAIEEYTNDVKEIADALKTVVEEALVSIPVPSSEEVDAIRQSLVESGLPDTERCVLESLGYTSDEVEDIGDVVAGFPDEFFYNFHDLPIHLSNWAFVIETLPTMLMLPSAVVPSVVGLSQAEAELAITNAGIVVGIVSTESSNTVPAGHVIRQTPAAGTNLNLGDSVDLLISSGPTLVEVPNVIGMSPANAEAAIETAGLTVGAIANDYSDTVPAGNVISQGPSAGTMVIPGSPVDIVVSLGPSLVEVPNVVGMSLANAEAAIENAGLTVGAVANDYSGTVPAGNVISQGPVGGTMVIPGSEVSLVISLGPSLVEVPNVVGMSEADAEAAIINAGLTIGAMARDYSNTVPAGQVIGQGPVGGTMVIPGSAVDLVVSLGPLLFTVPNVVGLSQTSAETAIIGAGLVVGNISPELGSGETYDKVVSQIPSVGTEASEGTAVDLVFSVRAIETVIVLQEDYESGGTDWTIGNGIWEIGTPTAGPGGSYSGTQCAGTVLNGNYPAYTDSRLVSATFQLPAVSAAEELHLRFMQWFSYSSYDSGQVQIQVQDEATGEWGDWQDIGPSMVNTSPWSLMAIEITAYAGETVRLGFYHTAHRSPSYSGSESTGWYIDDIEVVAKVPEFTGGFETGWGDWSADGGIWQVGPSTSVPGYSGNNCAGTVLNSSYHAWTDSRLVSATFQLPAVSAAEELHLRFMQWFSYSSYDSGQVQIQVQDEATGEWEDWQDIGPSMVNTSPWSLMDIEITAYAGETVRLGFYHTAHRSPSYSGSESTGWYIDEINASIINYTPNLIPINNQVMDENGTLNVAVSATDLDGDPITLSVTGLPGFGTFADNGDGTGSIVFNPGYGDSGAYPITVTASDGTLSDTEPFTLTVYNINQAPVLASIGDQTLDEGSTLTVGLSASSPDAASLSFSASDLPSFASLTDHHDGTASLVLSPGHNDAGTYPVTVTIVDDDNNDLSDSETFDIIVSNKNRAPILGEIGNQTVVEGSSLTVALSATDPDGDSVNFSTSELPPFASLTDNNNGTASLTLTPGAGHAGSYDVAVTVIDTGEPPLSDDETFTIEVHVVAIDVSPGFIDFGDVIISSTAYHTFTIANTGAVALEVTGIQSSAGVFSIFPPTSFTIEPAGPVRTVSVGFAPTAEGDVSGVISVISNAGDPVTIIVTGRGVLALEPGDIDTFDSLEFGAVVEESFVEQSLTITNTGGGPLTVTGATTDNAVFEVFPIPGDSLPLTIDPGASRNLPVRFTPPSGTAGTALSGTLTITSDDPDEGSKTVALSGSSIAPTVPVEKSPVLGARVYFDPDVFDVINASTCSDVGGQVQFGVEATSADSFYVTLTDQRGETVTSSDFPAIDGPGTATFSGIVACGLADGLVNVEVGYRRSGTDLMPFFGTPAVKYTGTLEPPVLDHVPPMSYSPTIQVCGTSRENTTVQIEGGASVVSTTLDGSTTDFCLDVPLRPNTQNTLIASAIDDAAPAPKPVAYAAPVQVVQLDLSDIVIVNAYSRPLTVEEIEDLVDRGIIDLDDPSNFNVSMFTIVFTIGSFPLPITISQPVVINPIPGSVSYGIGGGWFFGGGSGSMSGPITNCAQIVLITDEQGQTIPGVIIIDGRIKTLKEFFQVTIALWNVSSGFNLSDMTASVSLPAGLTPMATGLGSDIPDVNLEGAVDTVVIGEIGPGETGIGQFIIRGDAIGTYDINVAFEGFVTGGGLLEPIPVSGSAGTTVQVLGPPELDVVVRFPTNPDGPDVTFGDIFDLIVEITNVSDRPALYASLELFVGGDAELVGINGNALPESNEIRSFGHIQPGQTVTAAFRLRALSQGEIIACQAIAAENINLTIDIGPDGVPCNIVNMYPANFEPLPPEAAPVVIGVNPAPGQTNIPITTSVIAVFTPRSECIVADTWTNVVVDYIDPLDPSKGLQVVSADLVQAGTFYLEELNALGQPVRHIPVDLTAVDPPAGGTTIAVLRLGLDSPHPNSQFFLTPYTTYRATLVGGPGGVCSASSGATMENNYTWTFSTGEMVIPPIGSCLLLDGSCTTVSIQDCTDLGGTFLGDGIQCPPPPPPFGACVFTDGSCGIGSEEDCIEAGGTYQGDYTECMPPIGACVLPDGSCASGTLQDCIDVGGTYQGDDSVCPPMGACMLPDGSCVTGTEQYCNGAGGSYLGDDTECIPPMGACMLPDGSCTVGTEEECAGSNGTYLGDGTECIAPPVGACLLPDGSCAIAEQQDCTGLGGTYLGDNTECPPTGACMLPDGSCVQTTEQDCLNAGDGGGEYQGDGTQCPTTGACILPDGCCTESTEEACTDAGGTYEGDGTQCPQDLVEIPDVTGMSEADAQATLEALCLKVEKECVVTGDSTPAGEVVSQDPVDGTLVAEGDLVVLGVSEGPSAGPINVEGSVSGVFVNPQGPSGMVTDGVGTDNFAWGTPVPSSMSSSLIFVASGFSALTEEEFSLGTLTFFNGTITGQSDADTVDLRVDIAFSNPDGINQSFVYSLELIDTPNIRGTSQSAQADIVKLPSLFSRSVFTVDGIAYTLKLTFGNIVSETGGFTERRKFFVYEGQSASAELRGKITACTDLPPTGACLLSDGSCIQTTEQDCMNVSDGSGEYLGDGTQCPAIGACILPDGCCTEGTQQDCVDAGGMYQGDNTECEDHLVEVPDVMCMHETDAQAAIEALCLKVETECVVTERPAFAGEVVTQEPVGGALVSEESTVVLGVSTGLSLAPITVEGGGSGVFVNPAGPPGMVITGVGTNDFAWGNPGPFGTGPSRLTFEGTMFSAITEQEFFLGTLTFYNGTIQLATDADTVDLKINMDLSTPDGMSQSFVYSLELIDTPNVKGTSPEAQADIVNLPRLSPRSIFTIDGIDYTLKLTFGNVITSNGGFSERDRFFVYEGQSASAELRGKITACVDPLSPIDDLFARAKDGKINIVWTPMDDATSYNIYRGITQGGPYALIAEGHITEYAVYADFGLTNDVTYYYVVRWVDAHGQESPDSNEASATPSARRRR